MFFYDNRFIYDNDPRLKAYDADLIIGVRSIHQRLGLVLEFMRYEKSTTILEALAHRTDLFGPVFLKTIQKHFPSININVQLYFERVDIEENKKTCYYNVYISFDDYVSKIRSNGSFTIIKNHGN